MFYNSLESYGEGLPIGWRLLSDVHRDRVVLLTRDDCSQCDFKVSRYSHRMTRTDLLNTTSSSLALEVFEEWRSMSREALGIGLYIAAIRPPTQPSLIPKIAHQIARLHAGQQQGIWALIRTGVPGDIKDVLQLAASCGLIPQTP
jgi:hypothetical protein